MCFAAPCVEHLEVIRTPSDGHPSLLVSPSASMQGGPSRQTLGGFSRCPFSCVHTPPKDRGIALALSAFAQYSHAYSDWDAFSKYIGNMATLSESGEIVIAETEARSSGLLSTSARIDLKPLSSILSGL